MPADDPSSPIYINVLEQLSTAITIVLIVEVPLTLFVFGPTFYNPFGETSHSILHFFDATILIITFVLEVILKGREREVASLLIILRLWRLVQLASGNRCFDK